MRRQRQRLGLSCFNPRPSSLTSEPSYARCNGRSSKGFQSTPVITDERTQMQLTALCTTKQFQSTPVITDERTNQALRTVSAPKVFQSTPVITDERTLAHQSHCQSDH